MSRSYKLSLIALGIVALVIAYVAYDRTPAIDDSLPQDSPTDASESMARRAWNAVTEWTFEDDEAVKAPTKEKRPHEVITDFKLLPSEVGGVIALEYGAGHKFISSISALDYGRCPTNHRELCIFHAGRYFKVNDEIREKLPSNVDFHLNY